MAYLIANLNPGDIGMSRSPINFLKKHEQATLSLINEIRVYTLASIFLVLESARKLAPILYIEDDSTNNDCVEQDLSGYLTYAEAQQAYVGRIVLATAELLYTVVGIGLLIATLRDKNSFFIPLFLFLSLMSSLASAIMLLILGRQLEKYDSVRELFYAHEIRYPLCCGNFICGDESMEEANQLYSISTSLVVYALVMILISAIFTKICLEIIKAYESATTINKVDELRRENEAYKNLLFRLTNV